jgi:hypothetical protein
MSETHKHLPSRTWHLSWNTVDSQAHKVTTAAIAAAATGYEKSVQLPFSVEDIGVWKEPLEPGKNARVPGFYDSVRTTTCPEAGRITFVIARFKDGTVQQSAAEGWTVPPMPRLVPYLTAKCPVVERSPTEIRAKLQLNSTGNVVGLSGPVLTKDDPELVAWVATQMKQWTFHPALRNGRAEEGDLDVEFILYKEAEPNLAAISLTSPTTLILFFPSQDFSHCIESFGFLRERTTIPSLGSG